jgi:UTP--glucose-1-phosphate uridylyltransferase
VTSLDTCPESELHLNGVVTGQLDANDQHLYKLERIAEKPSVEFARQNLRVEKLASDRYMCFFGIDLLTPKVFDILQKNYDTGVRTGGELQLRDAMARLRDEDGMYGVFMQGARLDTGIPHEYAHAFSVYDKLAK